MSSDVIALSRITYQKVMLNLVWSAPYNVIAAPAAAGPFVQLGNCSPDEHKCNGDKPIDCDRGGKAHFLLHFTLTLLTMAQLRRLVRSTFNR
jgi:hypothetical protein